jgi:hypothetical protein
MEHGGRVLRDFKREWCRVHDLMRFDKAIFKSKTVKGHLQNF